MDLADMVTVIENCKTFCEKAGRLPYLYITGGDPILHPLVLDIDEDPQAVGHSLRPHGKSLSPHRRRLPPAERNTDAENTSFPGRTQRNPRRHPPAARLYDATMAAYPLLRSAGIDAAIMTTVSRWNYRDIPPLIDEVVKNKADIFAFARYCPSEEDRDVCCSPEEYRDMMEKCYEKFQKIRSGRLRNHI